MTVMYEKNWIPPHQKKKYFTKYPTENIAQRQLQAEIQ